MSQFSLTDKQKEFAKKVLEFVKAEMEPRAAEVDEKALYPWDIIKKFSELILSSSQAMSKLISKLLDVRYIDSMQNPSLVSTNFTLLVTEIVEQYQTIAAKKNIVLIQNHSLSQQPLFHIY